MKAWIASIGLSFQAIANCSLLIPDISANFPIESEALLASSYIERSSLLVIPIAAAVVLSSLPPLLTELLTCSRESPALLALSSISPKAPAPLDAAVSMADSVCVMAVPPASASIPTELIAVANPSISWLVRPASVPDDASLFVIMMMSDSVVAKLLPRAVTELPKR